MRHPVKRGLVMIGLVTLGIVINLPLVWAMLASFDVTPDNSTRPPVWHAPSTDSYLQIVTDPNLLRELATSFEIAVGTTLITITIAFLAAYSLARAKFRGRQLVLQALLVLSCLPVIAYVVPLRDIMLFTRLYDTVPGIVLPEAALLSPLAVYVLFGYIHQLPVEIEQAAWLDGAGLLRMLAQVVLPTLRAGIAATAILVFVLSWNQLLIPMILTAHRVQTLPVMLSTFFTYERELEWETAAVALVVTLLPLIVFVGAAFRLLEHFSLVSSGSAHEP